MEGGISILKFATIALYAIVLVGLLINVGKGVYVGTQTGDWRPLTDATIGQVFYWDNQIYEGVTTLKNTELMNNVPENFKAQFKDFVVRQIVMYLALFAITAFLLFKFGNWLAGSAAFEASTDIIIIAIILLVVFPLAQIGYGYIVHGEFTMPYRGVAELFKADTWNILVGSTPIDVYGNPAAIVTQGEPVRQVVNIA